MQNESKLEAKRILKGEMIHESRVFTGYDEDENPIYKGVTRTTDQKKLGLA